MSLYADYIKSKSTQPNGTPSSGGTGGGLFAQYQAEKSGKKPVVASAPTPVAEPKRRFFEPDPNKVRIRDVIREIPTGIGKTAKGLYDFSVDVLQGIFRSGGSVGLSLSGNTELKIEDDDSIATQVIKNTLFGEEPVKDLATRIAEGEIRTKEFATRYNLPTLEKGALPLAFGGVIGTTALDFTGAGGGAKNVSKVLAKTRAVEEVAKILRQINVAEDIIPQISREISELTDARAIENVLEKVNVLQTSTKIAPATLKSRYEADTAIERYIKLQDEARNTQSPIRQKIADTYNFTKRKLIDSASPIEDALENSLMVKKLISNQIDRVLRAPTLATQFIKDKGFARILQNVDDIDKFDQYLIAKQASWLDSAGITTGRDLKADQAIIHAYYDTYEQQAKAVTQYSRDLLDYSVETGLVDAKLAARLKTMYPDYVPMERVFKAVEDTKDFGGRSLANVSTQTVLRKIQGSERQVESPIATLVSRTAEAFMQGERNKAAKLIVSTKDLPNNPMQLKLLKSTDTTPHTISFLENGKKVTYGTTKEIAEAAKSLNVEQMGILVKAVSYATRILRLGTTALNIPFIAANLVKDPIIAFINADRRVKGSLVNPAVYLKGIMSAIKHDELYDEVIRAGGGYTSYDLGRDQARATVDRIVSDKDAKSKIKYLAKNPSELLRAIEDIVGRSEEVTRLQQYVAAKKDLVKSGLSEAEAQIEAIKAYRNNTANFARRGEYGTVLNAVIPYFNAGIQGSRAFVRRASEDPVATGTKVAAGLFLPTTALTLWNLSDPERKAAYDDIQEFEKENNLIFIPQNPTKDDNGNWKIVKIPLPAGINNLTIPVRRFIEQANGLKPVEMGELANALIGTVSPIEPSARSIASTLTPQIAKPTLEATTNTNFFTGLPIVPRSLEKLSPELQVRDNTSGTARAIGSALDVSPLKVEQFIRSSAGEVGQQLLNASDRALAGLDLIPPEQVGGRSVLRGIVRRFTEGVGGAEGEELTEKLTGVLQAQADENFRLTQEAEMIHADLKSKTPEEANLYARELRKTNRDLYNKLKSVAEEEKLGLNYNERLMRQLQVKNGERAKFIFAAVEALETREEKNAYITDLRRKKIVTDEVAKQIKALINK